MSARSSLWLAALLVLLCAAILISQAFIRPAIGIADNGDFPKMAGPLALAPAMHEWANYSTVGFFYAYVWAAANRYRPGFWSSELLFVKMARGLQRALHPGTRFDIRWLGAVHGAVLLLGLALWIFALPGWWRLWLGLAAVLIWTDAAYVQYLNSFYMDAAALVSLVVFAGAGLHATRRPNRRAWAFAAMCAALLFAATKAQHAIPALAFIPLFAAFAYWSDGRVVRSAWIAGAVLLAVIAAILVHRTTPKYKTMAVFNLAFLRIVPEAPDPLLALRELGLGRGDLAYLGHWVSLPDVPLEDPRWVRQFSLRCNFASILRYYLHHPAVPARLVSSGFTGGAASIRPFANRSIEDGFPPNSQAVHFVWWSDFRARLLAGAPWHLLIFFLLSAAAAVWLLFGSSAARPFAALALSIQSVAVMEYAISVLADAAETGRHLFLFHAATDITLLFFPLLIWKLKQSRERRERSTSHP